MSDYRYSGTFCDCCGKPRTLVRDRMCQDCYGRLQAVIDEVRSAPVPDPKLAAFDASIGAMRGAQIRTEQANQTVAAMKRGGAASPASYFRAKGPPPLTEEGAREARALGLVHYKTTHKTSRSALLSIEIDPLLARANRLRKSVITSARLHDQEAKTGGFRGAWYFLTLTYREGRDSSPSDIRNLLTHMRGFFNRTRSRSNRWKGQSFRYVWVGELTKRLRPHYHVMVWVPKGMYFGKVDQRGWWPHGSTQIEKARNCVGYLAKYASKFTSVIAGAFPKGFRTHGVGGLGEESRRELRWWKAAKEAREVLGADADIRKCKGGWFDRLTGEFWPSPWKVSFISGRTIAWKVIPL